MTRVALAALCMIACGGATPARNPTAIADAGTIVTPPSIHDAFVARELALVMKSPVNAIPPSVFVFLGEPARIDTQKAQPWIVARDAVFEVADDGIVAPETFTAFPPEGSACVGHATRKVLLRTGIDGASPKVQRGMVLEGCTPSPNTYALLVMRGDHASTRRIAPAEASPSARPAWSPTSARAHRYGAVDLVVVVAVDGAEWHVGTGATKIGTVAVTPSTDAPILLVTGDQKLLVGANETVLVGDALVRSTRPVSF